MTTADMDSHDVQMHIKVRSFHSRPGMTVDAVWFASRRLSSGAHSRDPLAPCGVEVGLGRFHLHGDPEHLPLSAAPPPTT
jgi:hypothetical protein